MGKPVHGYGFYRVWVAGAQCENLYLYPRIPGASVGTHIRTRDPCGVCLSEGSGQKQTNNQHQMTTVVSGGLPLQFWYQTSSRCVVHAFGQGMNEKGRGLLTSRDM